MISILKRRPLVLIAGILLLFISIPLASWAADAASEAAYQRQFQALEADDLTGHLALARWCRDQQAWQLLMRQSNYVLTLDPNHSQAKLLLELAKSRLPSPPAGDPQGTPTGGTTTGATAAGKVGLLTDEQVQILRRKELRLTGTERVKVNFKNNVLDRAWELIAAREGWTENDRRGFNKLSAAEQAQFIFGKIQLYERAMGDGQTFEDTLSSDIEITTDPWLFNEYKLRVWPIVLNGCATSQCHGGASAKGFSLYTDRIMTDNMHYTNYLILHERTAGAERVINRDFPDRSLLLTYGQPLVGNEVHGHPVEIPVLYRSARDRKYETILAWIKAMGLPAPEYGFSVADLN